MGFGGIRIDSPRISERPNVQAAGLPHPRIEVVRVPAFSLSKSAGTLCRNWLRGTSGHWTTPQLALRCAAGCHGGYRSSPNRGNVS
jgi:hypothetical protein